MCSFSNFLNVSTGETVNSFLNENHRELFSEYKKDIFKPVGNLVSTVVDGALATFSPKHFLKDKTLI